MDIINTEQSISVALAFYKHSLKKVVWNLNYIENLHVKTLPSSILHGQWRGHTEDRGLFHGHLSWGLYEMVS